MSDENKAPEGEQNQLASIDEIRAAGEQAASEQAEGGDLLREGENESPLSTAFAASVVENNKREQLAELIAIRDRAKAPEFIEGASGPEPNPEFLPYRDCDQILAPGTIVKLNGIPCRLLEPVPVVSESLKEEGTFAEHLAASGNLAANASGLRLRYNASGSPIGINDEHGWTRLNSEIAKLEVEIAAEDKAEAEAAAQQSEQSEAK